MSFASRYFAHHLVRSPRIVAGSQKHVVAAARHRFLSSGSKPSARVVPDAPAITVTGTKGREREADRPEAVELDLCGEIEEEGEEAMEEMLQDGPAGREWGGPTRGGTLSEPTRFGDWERKGRCSDF